MKRDLSNLTEENIIGIHNWLQTDKEEQSDICPFFGEHYKCVKCLDIFPTLDPRKFSCPCQYFNITYVRRIAEQILLEKNFIPK